MKKSIYISVFILVYVSSIGQTVYDCSIDFHDKYKKNEFNRMRYQITKKTSDSLRAILETELQACIIGKKMEDYNLVGRSGRSYTAENLQGKVVLFNFWSVNCGPCIRKQIRYIPPTWFDKRRDKL
jgi:thiol-disulfide isomerase/thioredoxin